MRDERLDLWEQFKRDHPPGSWIVAVVKSCHPFGIYFDLGVEFNLGAPVYAFLDRIAMRWQGGEAPQFPHQGFPAVGHRMSVKILRYTEPGPLCPNAYFVSLTEGPMSVQELAAWQRRGRGGAGG